MLTSSRQSLRHLLDLFAEARGCRKMLCKILSKGAERFVAAGIRCDIYSTYLRRQGFNNLFTLEGGVQNYLKQAGGDMWIGSLFVFDERLAIPPPGVAICLLHQPCETQHLICMAVCDAQASWNVGSSAVAVLWTADSVSEARPAPLQMLSLPPLLGFDLLSVQPHHALTRSHAFSPRAALHAPSCLQGSKRPPGSFQQPFPVSAGSLQRCLT